MMNPKMTATDAAANLGKPKEWIVSTLNERGLPFAFTTSQIYFGHTTAKGLFQHRIKPKVCMFHIVKGGTGKTSLVFEFAIRASLYGAKVLCVDMDQQGNLTRAFNQDAENLPVLIDVLVDHHPLESCIINVAPGLDLLPSRFENSMLDEVLRMKKLPLDRVYREPFQTLKREYDIIVIDCPPSMGQSVAACALSADAVYAPVTLEKFALAGLEMAHQSIEELKNSFSIPIDFGVIVNKFEARTRLSQNSLTALRMNPKYERQLLRSYVRMSHEFPKALGNNSSIFDILKPSAAKEDIDALTQDILGIALKPDFATVTKTALSSPMMLRSFYERELA